MVKVDGPIGRIRPAMLAVAIAALGGCGDRAPAGQVVATVSGTDITRRDLALEAALEHQGASSDAALRGPVLADLVDRKLLVQHAHREGLDLMPEYLGAVQRDRDLILAGMVAQQIAATVPRPSASATRAFIDAHDHMFGGRTLFLVGTGDDSAQRQWIDGARLSGDDARRLAATAIGATITVPAIAGGPLTLITRRLAPVSASDSWQQARDLIRRNQAEARLAATINGERATARVRYQHGFGPAANHP